MSRNKSEKKGRSVRFAILAMDVVCLSVRENELVVRLMKTTRSDVHARNSIPGGLLLPSETAEQGAVRLLREKGEIKNPRVYFEQLYTMSALRRDPIGRVVSVAYLALVPWERLSSDDRKDTKAASWAKVSSVRRLAYDHDEILSLAVRRLRAKICYTTLIRTVLPHEFTLTELEERFELIIGRSVDKRNFRRKISVLNILKKTSRMRKNMHHRPASLWNFRGRGIQYIKIL